MLGTLSSFLFPLLLCASGFATPLLAPSGIQIRGLKVDFEKEKFAVERSDPDETTEWLLQLDGNLRGETRREMKAHGIEILRYMPPNAFVVRGERSRIDLLQSQKILGLALWKHEWKMDSELVKRLTAGGRVKIGISAFDEVSVQNIALELRRLKLPYKLDTLMLETEVPSLEVVRLANLRGIENVEEVR